VPRAVWNCGCRAPSFGTAKEKVKLPRELPSLAHLPHKDPVISRSTEDADFTLGVAGAEPLKIEL